ncbi:COX aromatic rich motif-containing protein [Mesorhizobium sp.]|uniref:COX aromatic rich motif-containing protein n=1 Tax=Mesorhizobium sp. TaxID=1871066 RepID=UPI00342970DF
MDGGPPRRRPDPDAGAYRELARQSQDVAPFAFSHVQPGLFDAVVRQYLPPAPGPSEGRGGNPRVHPDPLGPATPADPNARHERHGGG